MCALGEVFGLPRHVFDERLATWAEERGVLVKAIEDAALGMASVYRALELELPRTLTYADDGMLRRFQDLLVRVMPLDLVIDEEAADGTSVRVSRGSVAGSWGGITGTIRYFADRSGTPRAAIEGTQLQYAVNSPTPVIQVSPQAYYAVENGVWFMATVPAGP